VRLLHFFAVRNLTGAEEGFDEFALAANGQVRKPLEPVAFGNFGLRNGYVEVFADFAGRELEDLSMAGDGADLALGAVDIDRVIAAFAEKLAAVTLQVANQVAALHAADSANGSRITSSFERDSSASWRLASKTICTASSRLARASARVFPCVFAPGSSSTNAA